MTETEQILALRRQLHDHNRKYYVLNEPDITDEEFDRMMRRLQDLEALHPDMYDPNSPSQRVGSDLSADFLHVAHKRPMLSLANTYSAAEVTEWYESVSRGLAGEPFDVCCELKFDGLSISLTYVGGRLERAVTRGDGVQGDDVTANVRTIGSIPLILAPGTWPDEFEIRGEILMPWTVFERLNEERAAAEEPLFANPRNAASGTLKSRKSSLVAARHLDSYLYHLLGDTLPYASHYDNLCAAAEWGFKMSTDMRRVTSLDDIFAFINHWDIARKDLPVATDGVVLKVDSLRQQTALGFTAKSPRWAIAYKYKAERACTVLREVTYQVGRTGQITPVANMDAVQLAGTTVRRATLNNEDFIRSLDLHTGDSVYVEKGGEIIPKIVGVARELRPVDAVPIAFVDSCPECGTRLVRYDGEAAHYCPNDTGCPPQIKGRIEHFISRKAMDIDSLGPETVDDYYSRGLIADIADLYDLRVEQINAGGQRQRSAEKIIAGIQQSTNVPFERVVYALGIRFVGETSARSLARYFKDIDTLMAATEEQLTEVEGIGSVIAASVRAYFADEKNRIIVERLRRHGVSMALSEEQQASTGTRLAGKSIVISGVFERHSRDEYKQMIERHGGKNVGSISGKTSFVLAGSNMGPSKLQKAQKLGIAVVSEDEFLRMIEG